MPRPHPLMPRPHPLVVRPHPLMPRPHPHMPRPHPLMPRPHPLMPRPHPLVVRSWPCSQAPPSFLSLPVKKRERAWYLFSREWRQDRKDDRKGLIVYWCTRPRTVKRAKVPGNLHKHLASRRQLSYIPSVERVVGWKYTKHSLLVLQILWIHHTHLRKDTRLFVLFRTASNGKLGGAWNKGYPDPTL